MNKKIALSALVACAFTLGISQADTYANAPAENDMLLDSIVITATRTPVEASKANANITVITAEDIAKNHYQDLSE
ncbi:MAG: TonB-dependent receptor, partial [Selenomonadales bacterium]|nr:TonB-dependent receptor [Selenomonadales bacterium]